ncbi:DNA polymerase I [Candidatus Marinimicrobia bacterium]|nr:DNA polymerase I [Candidatus Neomarinimicrobiota bacterium]
MEISDSKRKRLFIVDGYAILYRAHFALIRNPLVTSYGLHTSALYGFINQILKLIKSESPEYLVCAFDSKEKTFRHDMYDDYKANRPPMPEELQTQLPHLWEILEIMNIPVLKKPGVEADDIIGTIAVDADKQGLKTFIVSGDKDFMQLINNHISMYSPGTRKSPTPIIYTPEKVEEKWGIPPNKIIDLLGLMGDSADNIPGVAGVGEKTAVKLLKKYGSLESALENADNITNKRVHNGLKEGVENAKLSKELATILTDVKLGLEIKDLKIKKMDVDLTVRKFTSLEFHAFVKQINSNTVKVAAERKTETNYLIVNTKEDLSRLIKEILTKKEVSFSLITNNISPMNAEIIGISFCFDSNKSFYIPIFHKDKNSFSDNDLLYILNELKVVFESTKILKNSHNIKYNISVLKNKGINVSGLGFDTMIASHLINPSSRSNTLDSLSLEYLNIELESMDDLLGRGRNKIKTEDVDVQKLMQQACDDSYSIFKLKKLLQGKLVEIGLSDYLETIETPLINVLLKMEHNGAYVDSKFLKQMSEKIQIILDDLTKKIYSFSKENFNINSTQQMANLLFDELNLPQIKKRSTAEEVLNHLSLQHELPQLVLAYRKYNKLKNTYIDSLPELINKNTGRIHSTFNQTIAATGRLSSTNPNFQNIPIRSEEGKEIRKAFSTQTKGWKILSADYSQIELRIMAHFSNDAELISSFNQKEDIHTRTASKVFNVSIEDVIPEMRRTAKIVNFGIMYGAGPFRLSQELGIPRKESVALIDSYFNEYPRIQDYIDSTIEMAKKQKFVSTIKGRKRPVWDADSDNGLRRKAAERMAINMPIQGTAAEMIKIAMIQIHSKLEKNQMKAKMILQIHDELLFEYPIEEEQELINIVISKMENAMELQVPLIVDYGVGNNWYKAH